MKSLTIGLALMAMVAANVRAQGAPAADTSVTPPPRAVLSKPYAPLLGEMMASTITDVLSVLRPIDAPMLAVYEKTEKKIELYVMGSRSTVDAAKQSLDELRAKGYPLIELFVSETYHASIDDTDITLIYLNRLDNNKEIVRRENGRYVVPE